MVTDTQRKVRLLAIEEEMARLELEMLMETGAGYLGPTFPFGGGKDLIAEDKDRFEKDYLNPALLQGNLEPFGRMQSIKTFADRFARGKKGFLESSLTPSGVWAGKVNGATVHVLFLSEGDIGSYGVVSAVKIGQTVLDKAFFKELWSVRASELGVELSDKQTALLHAILAAAPNLSESAQYSGDVRPQAVGPSVVPAARPPPATRPVPAAGSRPPVPATGPRPAAAAAPAVNPGPPAGGKRPAGSSSFAQIVKSLSKDK